MQENKKTSSSSEQYTKKSNRTLLFGGIILLLVFLTMLVLMSNGKKVQEEQLEQDWTVQSPDQPNPTVLDGDLMANDNAKFIAEPAQIEMNNVVLGSKVEAILTLTAEDAPVRFKKLEFAQQQADGFTTETTCSPDVSIEKGKNCIVKVLWNPIALQQLQNNLVVTWQTDSPSSFNEKTTTIVVKGQSTDSKDCVICEDIRKKEAAQPRYASGLDGQQHEMKDDGTIVINGEEIKPTDNNVYINKNGEIVAISPPEYIALNMSNELIGTISGTTNEVINANGENIGKTLGDHTIVDSKLTVLGAAVPILSVMNQEGKIIGKMTKEGTVVDGSGAVVGKVWVNHQVFSMDGKLIGYIRPWGLVADFSGKIIGAVIPDGTVINSKNETVANITPNGFAVNQQGELLGATIPQGSAVGPGCQSLGTVLQNGNVQDAYDQVIGKALIDGTIVNLNNEEIGSVVSQSLVINEKGDAIGYVNSEGKAVSSSGKVIGCINPDGTVSAGKKYIGAVLVKGHVIGYACGNMGTVFPNGEVMNYELKSVGHVMPDGLVKNAENKIIGLVVTRAAAVADGCRLLGLVSIDGRVLDLSNQPVGCITPEKTVINEKGETLGSLARRGVVYKNDGTVLGRLRLDGKVMDLEGQIIGCVNADGSVSSLTTGEKLADAPAKEGIILDENGDPTRLTQIGDQIYDSNGERVAVVNKNRVIVDATTGAYKGFIPPDGVVFSPNGLILGRYSSKIGYAVNQANERFGKVLPDMTVISVETGEIVGGLIEDKTAFMNKNGEIIGKLNIEGLLTDGSENVAPQTAAEGQAEPNTQTNGQVNQNAEQTAAVQNIQPSVIQNILGAVRGDGTVADKDGLIIGWKVLQGSVFSPTGKEVGTVTDKGEVISAGRTKIGTILGNGIAVSTNGKILGGVLPKMALAMGADGLMGYLAPDGKVTDTSGAVIGRGTPFGNVISSDGSIIAKLIGLNVYVDMQNKAIGGVGFDGSLKNKDNHVIGYVTSNGLAFDKSNQMIGSAVKSGLVISETGQMVSVMAINNKVLQKEKLLGTASASPYIYSSDDQPIGRVLLPGVAVGNDGLLLGWTRTDGSIGTQEDWLGNVLFDNRVVNKRGMIIGIYVPFGSVAFNDKGQTVGVVGKDGDLVGENDVSKGKIHAADLAVQNGQIVGRLMCEMPFVNNNLLGKISGISQYNGEIVSISNKKIIGNLMMNHYVTASNGQVVAEATRLGTPVTNTYNSLGEAYFNGIIALKNTPAGKASGIGAVYDDTGKLLGSILPPQTFIGKTGNFIGKSAAGRIITDRKEKQVATQMNAGFALTDDNIWAGSAMPSGLTVNDDAQPIGTIMPDGIILDSADSIVGRILAGGAVIEVTDKEFFNTMPYAGAAVPQGMPFSYKGKVLGTTTLNGDVQDSSGTQIFKLLDDGTILGKDEPLEGTVLPFTTAIGYKGEVLGALGGNGKVLSPEGDTKGTIAANETVKASEYKIVGALTPSQLITNDCKVVGVVSLNGQVVDAKGTILGYVKPDKWAVNSAGEKIGRVTRVGMVIADNGEYLGRTLPDSTVVDLMGVNMGCAKNDGKVVDNAGNAIANVIERGLVLGKDGKPLGRIKSKGQVVNKTGEEIGRVLGTGKVVSKEGKEIGHAVSREEELLYDKDGNIKGTLSSGGDIRDAKTGQVALHIDQETGKVYTPDGQLIGELKEGEIIGLDGTPLSDPTVLIDKDGHVFGIVVGCDVKNNLGEKIGSILPNGNVVDLNGDVYARILGDGTILDKEGNEMGRVSGTDTHLDRCGIKTLTPEEQSALGSDLNGSPLSGVRIDPRTGKAYTPDGKQLTEMLEIRDKNGNVIARIDPKTGKVYNAAGEEIGTYKDGEIRDKDGNLIARIDPKTGKVYNAAGEEIGEAKKVFRGSDGTIFDPETEKYYTPDGKEIRPLNEISGGGAVGHSIIIGSKKYGISDKGSIIDENGTIIGYMGEDGKPYTLDNRVLSQSGDVAGRSRPDIKQTPRLTPAQIQQMQTLLTEKRERMRLSMAEHGKITANSQIQARSRPKKDKKWKNVGAIVSSWPVDMSRVILKDKAIPAVIVRSIDSRFSNVPVTAIVERHVYAEQGRNILIPAGSRVIGKMSSGENGDRVAKMEITWERLIRPDGGAFSFSATSGDAQGRGGVAAYLDDQLINKYGKPIMTSVVTSAISYMMAANDDYQTNLDSGSTQQSSKSEAANDARKNFIDAMERIFNTLIQEATEIPNVVFVPSGTRVTIFSNEDLWLRSEDDDVEEYEKSADFVDTTRIQEPQNNSSWVDSRTQANSDTNESNSDKEDNKKEKEQAKKNTQEKQPDDSELPNYYAPNSSYKTGDNSSSSSTPVYNGAVEEVPLKERTTAPVLPKTGSSGQLF